MSMSLPLAFLPGSPGPGEMLLIFVVVLILFGPKRLPRMARMIGKVMEQLRRASQDFHDQIMKIDEPPPVDITPLEQAPEPEDKATPPGNSDPENGDRDVPPATPAGDNGKGGHELAG